MKLLTIAAIRSIEPLSDDDGLEARLSHLREGAQLLSDRPVPRSASQHADSSGTHPLAVPLGPVIASTVVPGLHRHTDDDPRDPPSRLVNDSAANNRFHPP